MNKKYTKLFVLSNLFVASVLLIIWYVFEVNALLLVALYVADTFIDGYALYALNKKVPNHGLE